MVLEKTKDRIKLFVVAIAMIVLLGLSLGVLLHECSKVILEYGSKVIKHIPIENGKLVIEIKESKKEKDD